MLVHRVLWLKKGRSSVVGHYCCQYDGARSSKGRYCHGDRAAPNLGAHHIVGIKLMLSRKPSHSTSSVPAVPNPRRAVEMTRDPK